MIRFQTVDNPPGCIEGSEGPSIKIRRRVYAAEEQQHVAACRKNFFDTLNANRMIRVCPPVPRPAEKEAGKSGLWKES